MLGLQNGIGIPTKSAGAVTTKLFDLTTGTLPAGLTFSRSSPATYISSSGQITTASTDAPRFTYDPVTLAAQGLLIEDASTNLTLYSDDFSNAYWSKYQSSVTSNTATSPDGTFNADTLADNAVNDQHTVSRATLPTSATSYTYSVYMKAGTASWGRLTLDNGSAFAFAHFNLSAGTVGASSISGSTLTNLAVRMEAAGNGWYRCSITVTAGVGSLTAFICIQTANSQFGYLGTGSNTILIFGSQFEQMPWPTSYIQTTIAVASRSRDTASATFGTWFNPTEGTLYTEGVCRQSPSLSGWNCPWASLNNGTSGNEILQKISESGGGHQCLITTGGVAQMIQSLGSYTANIPMKVATAYKLNDSNAAKAGTAGTTNTACTLPPMTQLLIGGSMAGTSNTRLNGTLKKVAIYPTRYSTTQLQAVTT